MKKIAFSVQKGGTGKTTTSVNVAHGLARRGYKTCLVDCDPQGNATTNYLKEPPENELADILDDKVFVREALVQIRDNLFLLPTFSIGGGLKAYSEKVASKEPYVFQDLAEELLKLKFDYVIYDLSPAFGDLESAILNACDEVITPILPEYFSIDGIQIFSAQLDILRKRLRSKVRYDRVVINNVNMSLGIHKDMAASIQKAAKGRFITYIIPQDVNLKNAQGLNESIYDYHGASDKEPGQSRSVTAYEQLVGAL